MTERTIHLCADDCGSRVYKRGARCQPCHFASLRGRPAPVEIIDPAEIAERASAELLRRHLTTGQHWLVDPARFVAACESVGL